MTTKRGEKDREYNSGKRRLMESLSEYQHGKKEEERREEGEEDCSQQHGKKEANNNNRGITGRATGNRKKKNLAIMK